jgi:hypothetical protein
LGVCRQGAVEELNGHRSHRLRKSGQCSLRRGCPGDDIGGSVNGRRSADVPGPC